MNKVENCSKFEWTLSNFHTNSGGKSEKQSGAVTAIELAY